ncbi:signal peptidase I [Patescibacteria group bacterium]|nr:signal peptidase I [Patescibacteria group bacterium]
MKQDTIPAQDHDSKSGFLVEAWEILKIVLVAAMIAIPIRYFIAQPFIVKGASMEPNFEDTQYLIIDETSYYFRSPERGEVVVFRYPLNPSEFFIKRVIGLPGERVEIKNGKVMIYNASHPDGFVLQEPYLPQGLLTSGDKIIRLSEQQYFVLGDNRERSSDSRVWGPVDRRFITGRVLLRAWPISEIGLIREPSHMNP